MSEFHEPFRPSQIPSDAKFAVEAYIGGSYPGIGVLVNTFYGEMEHKENKGNSIYDIIKINVVGTLDQRLVSVISVRISLPAARLLVRTQHDQVLQL